MIRLILRGLVSLLLITLLGLYSCNREEVVLPASRTKVTTPERLNTLRGFYLLNEGSMGRNKSTLDYFEFNSGIYFKNLYAERNPNVVKELGDVGNDIQIYGSRLYAVINVSHLIEVMDVRTAKHLGKISIPNCRYITFKDQYAYVSSYAGPVKIDPNARLGYVAKVDTATMKVVAECPVGYQPDELVIVGNRLYVANSGGYRVPNYDRTVSVIDLDTFTEIKKIDVAINLHRMEVDAQGKIWVSSRGNYYKIRSKLFVIDPATDQVTTSLDVPCSNMTVHGDRLYLYSVEWSYIKGGNSINYSVIDTKTQQVIQNNFITDGTEKQIKIPYGLAINPETEEILVTDAKDYITPGTLYCFSKEGKLRWKTIAGEIPAHIVFVPK